MGIAEIFGLRPSGEADAAAAIYRAVVAQARTPAFFDSLHVPDSLDGRFETLALHLFLVVHRLKSETSETAHELSRAVLEAFVTDMDRSLREIGAADLGVGRRVKAMTEALYGRIKAYEAALAEAADGALEAALRRNLYGTVAMPRLSDLGSVAGYVRKQHAALASRPAAELLAGRLEFLPVAEALGPEVPS